MKKSSRQNLRKITVMAMLAAVAVVSVYFIKFPLLPSAPFLEYDIADVPVLIGTMLFGPSAGLVILLITSAIQAITVSSSSHIIGFIMHFCASGVLVLASGLMYKKIGGKDQARGAFLEFLGFSGKCRTESVVQHLCGNTVHFVQPVPYGIPLVQPGGNGGRHKTVVPVELGRGNVFF